MSDTSDNLKSNLEACPDSTTSNSLKPCCACPETRKVRDECVFLKGEESCIEYIEKHQECLKSYGFLV